MEGFFTGILWGLLLGVPSGLSSAHLLLRTREQGLGAGLLTGLGTAFGIACYGGLVLALFPLIHQYSQGVLFLAGGILLLLAARRILWPQRNWAEEEVFPIFLFFPSAAVVALSCPGSLAAMLLGESAGLALGNPVATFGGILVGAMIWNGFFILLGRGKPQLSLASLDRGCGVVLGTTTLGVSLWGALF